MATFVAWRSWSTPESSNRRGICGDFNHVFTWVVYDAALTHGDWVLPHCWIFAWKWRDFSPSRSCFNGRDDDEPVDLDGLRVYRVAHLWTNRFVTWFEYIIPTKLWVHKLTSSTGATIRCAMFFQGSILKRSRTISGFFVNFWVEVSWVRSSTSEFPRFEARRPQGWRAPWMPWGILYVMENATRIFGWIHGGSPILGNE